MYSRALSMYPKVCNADRLAMHGTVEAISKCGGALTAMTGLEAGCGPAECMVMCKEEINVCESERYGR